MIIVTIYEQLNQILTKKLYLRKESKKRVSSKKLEKRKKAVDVHAKTERKERAEWAIVEGLIFVIGAENQLAHARTCVRHTRAHSYMVVYTWLNSGTELRAVNKILTRFNFLQSWRCEEGKPYTDGTYTPALYSAWKFFSRKHYQREIYDGG